MNVLILGGTRFVGRHIVSECLARGDDVVVLHRGQSPFPFDGMARHVLTDRRAPTPEASAVLAEDWDAVIDTNAATIDDVRPILPALRHVGGYVLLSTCGVYRRAAGCPPLTERSPTISADASHPARASAAGKLRCERHLRSYLDRGIPLLIARLGLVVGAFDTTERFSYWLERALLGGDVLVPMDPGQPLQLIDATDVARFLRDGIAHRLSGVMNVVGPRITAWELLDTLMPHAGDRVTTWWVGEDFALSHGVRPWTQIPLWLPTSLPERALMSVEAVRAETSGLKYRPLTETIDDCLSWRASQRGWSRRWFNRAREQELLQNWRG